MVAAFLLLGVSLTLWPIPVPTGLAGVLWTLFFTGTPVNAQSLMGIVMMAGIVVSNSILLVDAAHRQRSEGLSVIDAVSSSGRIRLRPIAMTSLATIIGMMPIALALGTGNEAYAPLARSIIGGLNSLACHHDLRGFSCVRYLLSKPAHTSKI